MSESYDYVVVGGGTAGAIVAARLSEDPDVTVCLVEAGPSDVGYEDVLQLRRWLSLLEGPIDLAYTTTLQPRGNAHIVHSRAAVLGGCSSHNTQIFFKPFPGDWQDWVDRGCDGWEPAGMEQYYERLQTTHQIVAEKDRNPILKDWIPSAAEAAGVQANPDWNAAPFRDGAGFLDVGYDPETGIRSSSSVAYLHPIMGKRQNLTIKTSTWVRRVNLDNGRAVSVDTDGGTLHAEREIVVCGGSIDTPRLLLLSGIGPADDLRALDIEVQHDLPGVGENLIDHPESIIVWELNRPLPPEGVMDADCALFVNRLGTDPRPDLMFHTYQLPFTFNTERLGYPVPEHCICMTPNIPRSRSVGRMWLLSSNPEVKPALDFNYFTDADGYDEQTIVDGLKIAREVADTEPFRSWIKREVAPGPKITTDQQLSSYGRAVHHTVYHPSGTCRMGAAGDDMAVVDPTLRVRGLEGLSIADGSIFPTMPTVNPMVGTFMIGEKAADMIRERTGGQVAAAGAPA
jgi:choline dehydrogenase-like flavoprotein